jgi:hypothetical protein
MPVRRLGGKIPKLLKQNDFAMSCWFAKNRLSKDLPEGRI